MFPRSVLSSAIALGLVVVGLPAFGSADEFTNGTSSKWGKQAAAGQAGQVAQNEGAQTPEVLPEPGRSGAASEPAPAKRGAVAPMAGYAYADKPTASAKAAPHARYRKQGPVVNMPGFEQTADGGSRLFVQLSQNVPVEERKTPGTITYVLKGASPRVHNNTNALVTVHFNTPVASARLVPRGQDLHFVVDLRAAATPTWKLSESADKTSTLTIDFPKGDYLPAASAQGPSDAPEGEQAAGEQPPPPKAAPKVGRGKRAGAKPAPASSPVKKEEAPAGGPKP